MDFETTATPEALLARVDFFRSKASQKLDPALRSEMGQFFTPSSVASLMASMLSKRPQTLNILDAGAGVGSLSAACVAELCQWQERPYQVNVTAYEIEPVLREYLHVTLNDCAQLCKQEGIHFDYEIIEEDFIAVSVRELGQGPLFAHPFRRYNCAILNPPYRKINSASQTRSLLRRVGVETSNLYAAFLWLAVKLLEAEGELVAITPRSFCNGPYFRPFRRALLDTMSLRQIHIFDSRSKAFEDDDVLQENIILHATKSWTRDKVVISASASPNDGFMKVREVGADQLVQPDDPDAFIHIVPDELSERIGQGIQRLSTTLDDLGISVSTGRVVDFRAKHLLRMQSEPGTAPLIYPGHLSHGFVTWPNQKIRKPNALALLPEADGLLVPAGDYVLVKRFSSKEEKRRVVAAICNSEHVPGEHVGFENHLNYYHRNNRGLNTDLAKGLTAFLNSTLVDEYFRQFNGHTQINATDLRNLKYPDETTLIGLGVKIGNYFPEQEELDRIVLEELNIMAEDSTSIDPFQARKKISEALAILKALNFPRGQQNDRSSLTLLALLGMKGDTQWSNASNPLYGITEIMDYIREHFGVDYAPNTRETVRRQTMHQFIEMGLVLINPDDLSRSINSPHTCYQIEPKALELIRNYGTNTWDEYLTVYLENADSLRRLLAAEREMTLNPVRLPTGDQITLSAGGQNVLIKDIIEQFCPRFTPGGTIVYIGDAGQKLRQDEIAYLKRLGAEVSEHGKMPDVIVHYTAKNWLVLIEAVTSHGPIHIKRHNELKALFQGCEAGLVFVTAFQTRKAMMRYLSEIAWETDVWVAEAPTHLIHFNGEHFLGPYQA